jgi:ATP phosphoribosyltransferase regulatory subunit HisZ
MNYYEDLNINKLKLDEEAIKLPTINMRYHDKLSKAIKKKDDLKLELEVLEAEIDKEIRDKAEKKPSETQIKNMVIMDKRRIKKVKELNETIEDVNILKGAVNSFDKKDNSLKNLTNLYTNQYYKNDYIKTDKYKKKQREGLNND